MGGTPGGQFYFRPIFGGGILARKSTPPAQSIRRSLPANPRFGSHSVLMYSHSHRLQTSTAKIGRSIPAAPLVHARTIRGHRIARGCWKFSSAVFERLRMNQDVASRKPREIQASLSAFPTK